ncbi:MAG TPA: hypothetical protein VND15_01645 [Candidatus Acidoferrales bacterium]|nr:hypothetical protein [Candidatus Acidoferrales bacterium]
MFNYDYILIVVVSIALTFVSYRSIKGTKFRRGSTSIRIVVYFLILAYSVANAGYPYYIIGGIALAAVVGALAGVRFGRVRFYHKKGQTHYQRSAAVVVVWLIAILVRVSLTLLGQSAFLPNLVVDLTLSLTTGLMAGEAVHIAREYRKHLERQPG